MKATATETSVEGRRRSARPAVRRRRRCEAPLRYTIAPAQRDPALRRDDESHTPPHGDPVLPRQSSAQ
jgi:hypothetical protein